MTCECFYPLAVADGLVSMMYCCVNKDNPKLDVVLSFYQYFKDSRLVFYAPVILASYCIIMLRGAQAEKEYKATLELRKSVRRKQKQDEEHADPSCRICFGGVEEGKLISPCLCSGSIRFVHLACLNHWRRASANRKASFQCDQCGFKYSMRRTRLASVLRASLVLNLVAISAFAVLLLCCAYLVAYLRSFHPAYAIELLNSTLLGSPEEGGSGEDHGDLLSMMEMEAMYLLPLERLGLRVVDLCGSIVILGIVGVFFSGLTFDGLFLLALGRRRGRAEPDVAVIYLLLLGLVKFHLALYNFFKEYSAKLLQSAEENILEVGESYETSAAKLKAQDTEDSDIIFHDKETPQSDEDDLIFQADQATHADQSDKKAPDDDDASKEVAG